MRAHFFVSPPTAEMKEKFLVMQEARSLAFAMIQPGVPCAGIDQAANGFLREEGYGDNLLHRTGHGFGLSNHEGTWVAEGSPDVLTENMLISVEPGIYIPNLGGFRHSDTVLVTADGYESLTHYPDSLEQLTIGSGKLFTRLHGALVRRAVGI
jgi:Xaa-Pro dipeptidase